MVSVEEIKKMDHKTKIRIGLVMGIFCALYWGVWYVPGYAAWNMDILTQLTPNIEADGFGYDFSYLTTCLFLTGFNAIACAIVLFIWNGALGKLPELKRTTVQFKGASKYFLHTLPRPTSVPLSQPSQDCCTPSSVPPCPSWSLSRRSPSAPTSESPSSSLEESHFMREVLPPMVSETQSDSLEESWPL